ncbi:hypothetical protein BH10ACT8_BH10ACT8_02930 [soil metagenome]
MQQNMEAPFGFGMGGGAVVLRGPGLVAALGGGHEPPPSGRAMCSER